MSEKRKWTMDLSSENPTDWKLLRHGEPAGSKTKNPGSFDNAHLAFWHEIEDLRKCVKELEEKELRLEGYGDLEKSFGTDGRSMGGSERIKSIINKAPLVSEKVAAWNTAAIRAVDSILHDLKDLGHVSCLSEAYMHSEDSKSVHVDVIVFSYQTGEED